MELCPDRIGVHLYRRRISLAFSPDQVNKPGTRVKGRKIRLQPCGLSYSVLEHSQVDLDVPPEDLLFADQVRQFVNENLSAKLRRAGELTTSIFSDFDASMAWQKVLNAQGWAAPDWPEEYGGPGWSYTQRMIFKEILVESGAPTLQMSGILLLGPVLMKYGSEGQKELLPRILDGQDVWAQGFSEPNSGSDLASLRTRAVKQGDEYVIDGTKIWTSYAHRSNKIFCLVRTSAEGRPQAGISFVLVDLDTPGVTRKEILGLDGEIEQCQVFFDNVRIPATNLVGEENQGWEIARFLLEFERGLISQYSIINRRLKVVRRNAHLYRHHSGCSYIEEPKFRSSLGLLEIDSLALQQTENRMSATLRVGDNPGVLSSLVKLAGTELGQRVDELALQAIGTGFSASQNHVLDPSYVGEHVGDEASLTIPNYYLNNRAATIYGGSAQIQRNIIAKAILRN